MRRNVLIPRAVWLAIACTATTVPHPDLAGQWAWELNRNPGGSSIDFILTTDADTVAGRGLAYSAGSAHVPDSFTVVGRQLHTEPYTSFVLTFQFASGRVASYAGLLVGPSQMSGTWVEADQSHTSRFERQ
jgi:hypothetical protein